MRHLTVFFAALIVGNVVFACMSGGDGDDDSGDDAMTDDADDECITCQLTSECFQALGEGWGCVGGCCEEVGDDDADDDFDDDADDDMDDDADDDDADDDTVDDNFSCDGDVCIDSTSGLIIWQNGNDLPEFDEYYKAEDYCKNLDWGGYSDWYLPSISRLRSLIRGCNETMTGGACAITDQCLDPIYQDASCYGCTHLGGPGPGGAYWPPEMSGEIDFYLSSSVGYNDGVFPWTVSFGEGSVGWAGYGRARCLRYPHGT